MILRMLIVDDYPEIHKILTTVLEFIVSDLNFNINNSIHFKIDSAYQGDEALHLVSKAEGETYDIIFMDIMMPPGLNGFKAGEMILKIFPKTNIVFISAHSEYSKEDIIKIKSSEDNISILSKPFELDDLVTIVKKIIEKILN
jgi:two-component system sensor histidine kinase/response regulator